MPQITASLFKCEQILESSRKFDKIQENFRKHLKILKKIPYNGVFMTHNLSILIYYRQILLEISGKLLKYFTNNDQ